MKKTEKVKFKLTDKKIDDYLKKCNCDIKFIDTQDVGLRLEVIDNKQTWKFIKKINGKSYHRVLGKRNLMPLSVARKKFKELYLYLLEGNDPAVTKRKKELKIKRESITLEQALYEMIENSNIRESTKRTYLTCIGSTGTFKDYKDKPLIKITEKVVADLHNKKSKASKSMADKDCRTLRAVWNFAKNKYCILKESPTKILSSRISGGEKWNNVPRKKTSILEYQLKDWFTIIRDIQEDDNIFYRRIAIAMEILILTGLRKMEVLGLKWDWIDFRNRTINIPEDKSKNKLKHIRPMTNRVFELIKSMENIDSVYVFPNIFTTGSIKSIRQVQKIIEVKTEIKATANDLRRTFLSLAPIAGVPQLYIKALVNHAMSDVTEGYQVIDINTLLREGQKVENYILEKAGLIESNDDSILELVKNLPQEKKEKLLVELFRN